MSEAAGSDRAAHQYADSAGEIGSVCHPRKAEGAAVEVPCDCGNITYKATDTLTSQRECSCAECAGRRNAAKARENAGFVGGTQLCKLPGEEPSMPHDGKCRGVYYDKKRQLYEAVIKFRGKRTRLGYFRKFEDAVKARQVAEDDVFGEFRRQLETQRTEDEASG